jgi:epoxyqueuosine reductase
LTQKKGILPEIERNKIDNYLWGCDDCQKNCPYNKNIPKDLHSEFEPKITGNIVDILNYDRKEFPKKWENSALSWRGMRVIQRNALISLINLDIKKEDYRTAIIKKMKDNSPILRHYAYKAYISLDFDINEIQDIIIKEDEVNIKKIIEGSD